MRPPSVSIEKKYYICFMLISRLFGVIKNVNSDTASQLKRQVRLSICSGCPKYRKDFRYFFFFKNKGVPQCRICKCAINEKIIWSNEKCPINRW